MSEVKEIYYDNDLEIEYEEFLELVEDKVEEMGGLADEAASAMLVIQDLEDSSRIQSIDDIDEHMQSAKFTAKVASVGQLKSFNRDNNDSEGKVCNIEVADSTGQITLTFWNDQATRANKELDPGQVLKVEGEPQDGYTGLEINVDRVETKPDKTVDVQIKDTHSISELTQGQSNVSVTAIILNSSDIRTFSRDNGSKGRVANFTVGDETGRMRVTLWDSKTTLTNHFSEGDSVKIKNANVNQQDGKLELHIGAQGDIEKSGKEIQYEPDTADISNLRPDQTVDIGGGVVEVDEKRTFDRDDGSEGQVRNITVQDETGKIRTALWGDKADADIEIADEVLLTDAQIGEGWQGGLEASIGWQSNLAITEKATNPANGNNAESEPDPEHSENNTKDEESETTESNGSGITEYGDDSSNNPEETTNNEQNPSTNGYDVEVTGTVISSGDEVVIDTPSGQETVHTDEEAHLGEDITVRGKREDDVIIGEEVI